jgi:uncharacterized protein YlxW (UPF0749 family)
MIAELAALGVEFRADVKKACPKAKEEHLHGKIFKASEVDGILMDGQKNLAEVMDIVIKTSKNPMLKQNGGDPATATSASTAGSGSAVASAQANTLSTTLNSINMKEQFPAVFALLGVEEMQMQEGGAFMNEGLLATLNANIEAAQKEKADALALVESLTAEKNELTAKVEELTAQAETKEAEHAKAIEDLNAAHATALEEKDNQISAMEQEKADLQSDMEGKASQIETLTADLNGAKESLTTAETTIAERDATLAERDQQITDLNAQIAELQNDPGTGAQAGAAPQNNGGGAEAPGIAVNQYVYDPSLSYEKNMEAKAKWDAEHK